MKANQQFHQQGHTTLVAALLRSTSRAHSELVDDEFGRIILKRNANAKYVRLRMQADGQLIVTLPRFAAERHALELINNSRTAIRSWHEKHATKTIAYAHGDRIGQSHTLECHLTANAQSSAKLNGLTLEVRLANNANLHDNNVQQLIRPLIGKALQKEARAYLPRRLRYLADQHGFMYKKVRFGTQKGRWGSCSSSGTISLNVALMALDPNLIDYVLIHELCHTEHMNHSARFWSLVESCLPDYKLRRKRLKTEQPTVTA